jgi:UDP-N-acetylmuramate--alanine ligase
MIQPQRQPFGRNVHFIGIGGIGMSAIARLLVARGLHVSGSDVGENGTVLRLREEGMRVHIGHRADNVAGADTVVVTSAVTSDNPEVIAAHAAGKQILSRGEMLARIIGDRRTIAIAGTHGKTTTTAMTAAILESAGFDPSVAVGGIRADTQTNARHGEGEWFVTESDESDGSFLYLDPAIAVVTNIENDHIAADEEMPSLIARFHHFLEKVPADGLALVGVDEPRAGAVAAGLRDRKVRTFGITAGMLRAVEIAYADLGSRFAVEDEGVRIGTFALRVPGAMNVQNALGAIGVALALGIDAPTIARVLAEYRGVARRFQVLARTPRMTVVDDYAHHPTAVAATIAAARRAFDGPLVVAFQPHRYSRTAYLAADFTHALQGADEVYLTPVYAASEAPIPGISERLIGEPLEADGIAVTYAPVDELPALLLESAPDGALVLMLGAGNITNIAGRLAAQLVTQPTATRR